MGRELTFRQYCDARRQSLHFLDEERFDSLMNMCIFFEGYDIPFIVIGSAAFEACGVPIGRPIADLDFEVIADEEQEGWIKDIARSQGSDFNKYKDPATGNLFEHAPYVFSDGQTIVNIYVQRDDFSHKDLVFRAGIGFATIKTLLERKRMYRRPKDYKDLINIASYILNHVATENQLQRIAESKDNPEEVKKILENEQGD